MEALKLAVETAQNLCVTLNNALNYERNMTKDAEAKIKRAEEKENANDRKTLELVAREKEIKKVENLIAVEANGKALLEQIKTDGTKVAQAKLEVERIRNEALNITRKNEEEKKGIDAQWAKLRKEQEALKADRVKVTEAIKKLGIK